MGISTWFCRCDEISKATRTSCESCGIDRMHGERKDKDLSSIVKPPPKR